MNKLYITFLAGLVSAFFMAGTVYATESTCAPEVQESRITEGLAENPELLMAELEGESLIKFFEKMRQQHMIAGLVGVDKVYVFYSEKHPEWVYVYFLESGCILDVKFTFKNLIKSFLGE